MTPANALETSGGCFWGIYSTRNYMRARFDLADIIRRTGTPDGIAEALGHMRDMLRLRRSDNMGVRNLIPPMMLQLDRDQECYDFIKWYQTDGRRDDYDWGDMALPFLHIQGANVLEDVTYLNQQYEDPHHVASAMLLKLKLLMDVINVKLTRKVIANRLPPELWERADSHVIRSEISRQWVGKSYRDLTQVHQKLEIHVKLLARSVQNINDHFLQAMLEPDEYLATRPAQYSRGSFEEMQLVLHYSFTAWWQHEGILPLLHSAKAIAAKDSKIEIDDMMGGMTFRTKPGSDRSREEMLDDVSRNRLWGYFSDAVEDAMSLGNDLLSEMRRLKAKAAWEEAEAEEREIWATKIATKTRTIRPDRKS